MPSSRQIRKAALHRRELRSTGAPGVGREPRRAEAGPGRSWSEKETRSRRTWRSRNRQIAGHLLHHRMDHERDLSRCQRLPHQVQAWVVEEQPADRRGGNHPAVAGLGGDLARSRLRPHSNVSAKMSAEIVWYLDSSAIVKLIAEEAETPALLGFLRRREILVSSALATTEVTRAVLALGHSFVLRAGDVLGRFELVRVSDAILADAGRLEPASLRSLGAIHLATASVFEETLGGLVTYDRRMYEAAESPGWDVHQPA